ncbi:MAG: radical SAM protein, partial [Candidatus Thorarchaeota archaeon]
MMIKSFQKTIYTYDKTPEVVTKDSFGVYLHVPFCFSKCAFCPFYKEIYNEKQKDQYVSAIIKEIENSGLKGEASWLYIGGGTPNTLTTKELKQIINKIHENITVSTLGIELLPTILDEKYIEGLNDIGFTKISIGVESLSEIILSKSGRKIAKKEEIKKIIEKAHNFRIWVNVDLMIGLPGQDPDSFIEDIEQVSLLN